MAEDSAGTKKGAAGKEPSARGSAKTEGWGQVAGQSFILDAVRVGFL